jgi:hypothetical protein
MLKLPIKKTTRPSTKTKGNKEVIAKPIYRETITPTQKKVSITLPETLVGKMVEVFAFEVLPINEPEIESKRQFSKKDFWDTFGSGKNSQMTAEGIKENAWRKYEW